MKIDFRGSYPALITPFKDGKVDEAALRKLIRRVIRAGSSGVVPCGSTGEAATLSNEEYKRVIGIALEECGGKFPVIAGVGTNATWKAVEMAQTVEALGADAILLLTPYYNKPTQDGLFRHFTEVACAVGLPVVVYNIPGRTAVNLLPATLARLAKTCPNIAAVKEASGSLDQVSEIVGLCGPDFAVLSGDDSLTLPMMAVGAKGVISVVANLAPGDMARLCGAFLSGDARGARAIHRRLYPLIKMLFIETNPIPVKAAAKILGIGSGDLRLPMTPLSPEHWPKLKRLLQRVSPK